MKNLSYICLYVSNLEESARFYKDILGLEPENPDEDPSTSSWYSFKTGTSTLALERNGVRKDGLKTKEENPFLLQFLVDSEEQLEALNKRLESNEVKLLDRSKDTSYGKITNFCDPDGNKLELIYQG